MARYIDAEQTITVTYYDEEHEEWSQKSKTIDDFLYENADEDIPTADVVEVVRCKECKHSIDDKLFGGLWCQHPTEKHCERNIGFYCGSGERREDVEETD